MQLINLCCVFLWLINIPIFPLKSLYLIVCRYRCETSTHFSSITLFFPYTYALGLFSCVHYCHLFQILPLVLQALAIFASFLFICFFLYVFLQLLLFSVLFSGSYAVDILKGRSNTYC
jgi:hypothetical protein